MQNFVIKNARVRVTKKTCCEMRVERYFFQPFKALIYNYLQIIQMTFEIIRKPATNTEKEGR